MTVTEYVMQPDMVKTRLGESAGSQYFADLNAAAYHRDNKETDWSCHLRGQRH